MFSIFKESITEEQRKAEIEQQNEYARMKMLNSEIICQKQTIEELQLKTHQQRKDIASLHEQINVLKLEKIEDKGFKPLESYIADWGYGSTPLSIEVKIVLEQYYKQEMWVKA